MFTSTTREDTNGSTRRERCEENCKKRNLIYYILKMQMNRLGALTITMQQPGKLNKDFHIGDTC